MVLVVFFHNLQLNPASVLDNIFVLLANTAVPVFFLVSGALFFHRPFTWKNHARHILQFYLAMIGWKGIIMNQHKRMEKELIEKAIIIYRLLGFWLFYVPWGGFQAAICGLSLPC